MELDLIIVTSVLGGAWLLLLVLVIVLWVQLCAVKRQLRQTPSIRVQKLRMDDKNHAFQNPTIAPDEELSRRGYSMYVASDADAESGRGTERYVVDSIRHPTIAPDEELSRRGYSMYSSDADAKSGRGTERQTGGQLVEELTRELDNRQQRQSTAPPFLLQSIQENKRKSRLSNPVAQPEKHGRQSETNPNFIY